MGNRRSRKKWMPFLLALVLACASIFVPGRMEEETVYAEDGQGQEEFVIRNGVLVEYNGSGGDVVIPGGIVRIGDSAFGTAYYEDSFCEITSVTMPDSVTSIGDYAFSYCRKLKKVKMPDSISRIGKGAFCGCEELTGITLPDGLDSIGIFAFFDCSSLREITVPPSVTDIGGMAFYGTKWLQKRQRENPLVAVNGILVDGSTCNGNVVIPDTITNIVDYTFFLNDVDKNLTSVTIPDSVTKIGESAFEGKCMTPPGATMMGWLEQECVFYGHKGSYAEQYIKEHKLQYISLGNPSPSSVTKGDLDGDGKVTLADARMVLRAALNLSILDTAQQLSADVDGVPGVSLQDARLVLKKALNLILDFDNTAGNINVGNKNELLAKSRRSYADILSAFCAYDSEYSMISQDTLDAVRDNYGQNIENNEYALCDLDGDGIEELLLYINAVSMADQELAVYTYDAKNNRAVRVDDGMLFPSVHVYGNGTVVAYESHNHTSCEEIFPFCLYQYDSAGRKLKSAGIYVEGWDKSIMPADDAGNLFPDSVDKDGDGIVYRVCREAAGKIEYYDQADFEKWFAAYTDNAGQSHFEVKSIGYDYTELLGAYKAWIVGKLNKIGEGADMDLAGEFVEWLAGYGLSGGFTQKTGDKITYQDMDYYYAGFVNGVEAVEYEEYGNPCVTYKKAVPGLTLFGVRPGDDAGAAVSNLKACGLYEEALGYEDADTLFYINSVGSHGMGFGVELKVKNGKIEQIAIRTYSRYAG